MKKRRIRKKKIMKWSVISVASLLLIYLGVSTYFMDHFYFGTSINAVAVSGKTVEEVNEELAANTEKYTLTLEGRDGIKEEISASEMGIKYNSQDKVQELIDSQNPFKWIVGVFNKTDFQISDMFSFDEKLLKESVDKLSYFDKAKVVEPKSASLKRTDEGYEIIKEVKGNKINRDILYEQIVSAILDEKQVLSLEEINCYENPKYTSASKEIIEAQASLNKYIGVTVTYNFTEGKEVLNGATINNWLKIDENFNVSFDEEKVKSYVNKLGNTYDTLGKPRDFKTSSGRIVKVSGGYYGVSINRTKETQELIKIIKEGKSISRKPIYSQNEEANSGNGIGNTYVEIDLTNQHMWFYKNGKLITHGNVVTGNADSKHSTPAGLYKITYKQKNAVLRGPGYAAPVTFWMPFNGDIGIHDATWRSSFGGNIYKNDGSHGCINTPYGVAEAIFNSIQAGDPVVCYH
nr:L,D-transpeptidase/peptidoglycan binding protein [Clostridium sp. UBA4548]